MKKTNKFILSFIVLFTLILLQGSKVQASSTKLSVPKNVKASISGVTNVKVKWSKVTNAKKYTIYRASSPKGKYKKVGTSKTTSFINKDLTRGNTYYYKVVANEKNSASKKSSYAKVTVLTKKAVLKKIRNALKDKNWIKNNVKMKNSVFGDKITTGQTLYFGKIKNKELVAVEAVSEESYSVQMFLVGYKNGKIVVTSSTTSPMHYYNGGPSIDLKSGIASVGYLHMGYMSESYFKVSNVKFNLQNKFEDNSGAMENTTYYKINNKKVSEKKYNAELKKYSKYKLSSLSISGYKLTNKNIDKYIK